MFYREYKDEDLVLLQKLELEILRDFIKVCDDNNIDYFGVGGTAIGAVRHGGFIPWDDDIDVGLTRENYEKFLKAARTYKPEKYRIVNARTDHNYPLPTTRWVLRGTKFREECFKDLDCDLGIFLDIYCFDNIPDDEKTMRRQGKKAWLYGKLMILASISEPVLYIRGWKAKAVLAACKVVHTVFQVLHLTPYFFYKKARKEALRYRYEETKRVAYFFDPQPYTSIIAKENLIPTRVISYEGIPMKFPGRVEEYLKPRYGDYMTMPPEDQRHNHPPYAFDFGPYKED